MNRLAVSLLPSLYALCAAVAQAQGQPAKAPSAFGTPSKSAPAQMGGEWVGSGGNKFAVPDLSMPSELGGPKSCQSAKAEIALLAEQNKLLKQQVAMLEDKYSPKKVAGSK